ncbi:transposase [Ascidiimonas meishanensis]|uniref:transposase n=1 Tax=Ascidiimonas meishanensis TaxID=3128903 RepID=UPI0039B75BE3
MTIFDMTLWRKCSVIKTVNDKLKNISQAKYSGHRSFGNFLNNYHNWINCI